MKVLKYYNVIISVLFVSIDNILPSKQYGRFWGISQFLVSLIILLFINFLEGVFVIITGNEYLNIVSFLNIDFYLSLGILLILIQFILNSYDEYKRIESIRLVHALKQSRKLNIVLVTFWSIFILLLYFLFYVYQSGRGIPAHNHASWSKNHHIQDIKKEHLELLIKRISNPLQNKKNS